VSKGKRENTKWRIVFNTSLHVKDAPSLNDTLEMRTNLLTEIFATLLRFLLNPLAIVADIHHIVVTFNLGAVVDS
jgi:hypothetical protein